MQVFNKIIEYALLIMAMIKAPIYPFYEADFLIILTMIVGIGISVLRFIRTYDKDEVQVLGNPDAEYETTYWNDSNEFKSSTDSFSSRDD